MSKSISLILVLLFLSIIAFSQSKSPLFNEYQHGKQMYQESRYDLAMEILKPLTLSSNKSVYSPYAGYYYSLAAIEKGYSYLAEEMLKQIIADYPEWEHVEQARFWLVKLYLDLEEYSKAIESIISINDETISVRSESLFQFRMDKNVELDVLKELYSAYPDFKPLGIVLADRIALKPILDQDRELLRQIVLRFDLDYDRYHVIDKITSEKKEEYNIAVMFPFMLQDIIPTQSRLSNQFILDLYEGIKLANDDLNENDIKINLFTFDTKKDSIITKKLLESGELDGIDLIIGPLYPDPVRLVTEFSLKNRINMFNPLSTNSDLIEKNPFCFLLKPISQRQALEAEKYVSEYCENKTGIIFYEQTEKDSIMAHTYKKAIEEDSFNIILTRKILNRDTFSVYNFLTRKVKFEDVALTAEDSAWYTERYDLYEYFEDLEKQKKEDEKKKIKPLELFVIAPDSIGHIFVATNKELIGANVISGAGTRGDSVLVIGDESWLNFRSLSLSQWELLDILLIAPGYVSNNKPFIDEMNNKVLNTYNKPASKYHYTGYEMMNFIGNMLYQYGIYFQTGMRDMGTFPGLLFEGFNYSDGNDNAIVPLIKFENSEFRIVNKH